MLCISSTDQCIITEGVASRSVTGCSVSVNNTFNSRCGDNFTAWVTKRSTAPLERARNSSTMLGSNVKGEARKTTSLDCTDRMDLKNKIIKHTSCLQHTVCCRSILKMLLAMERALKTK